MNMIPSYKVFKHVNYRILMYSGFYKGIHYTQTVVASKNHFITIVLTSFHILYFEQ